MPLPRFDAADYPAQLASKIAQFKSDFASFALPELSVYSSEAQHYRLRAEFRMWHQDEHVYYAMFAPDEPKRPVVIDDFPAACEAICTVMPLLRRELEANDALKENLFQANFLATLTM